MESPKNYEKEKNNLTKIINFGTKQDEFILIKKFKK